MGCCGDREKGLIVSDEQKWDYIVRIHAPDEANGMLTV
jgi:hypothetical protein